MGRRREIYRQARRSAFVLPWMAISSHRSERIQSTRIGIEIGMTDVKSPQLEDGFLRIANELFDAILLAKLKYSTQTVLLAVLRKTYGYGKKEDDLSASQIGELCGMKRQHVTTALNELATMGVIHKRPGQYGVVVGINKDYSSWSIDSPNLGQVNESRTSPNLGQVNESRTSPNLGQVSKKRDFDSPNLGQVDSPNLGHTKDNLPKDNLQKKKPCASAGAFARFWSAYPKKKSKGHAEKAFSKIDPSEQLLEAMLASIERAKTSANWRKDGGQFIPYPATWLNAKGWEDEDAPDSTDGRWWLRGGFSTPFEAENAGCTRFNTAQFHNGQRMEAHA